ncbi:hypothetical protein SESBI_00164 [Sesbania bispinosa]|nr:hypothetical protein SESBI_00164 [Sesbania bispinosa]
MPIKNLSTNPTEEEPKTSPQVQQDMHGPVSSSVDNNDQSQDSLHGEWMVVTRSKKSG